MYWVIDWLLKIEAMINKGLDFLGFLKREPTNAITQQNKEGPNKSTVLNAKTINIYLTNGTKEDSEHQIHLQEELMHDLMEFIVENENKTN